MIIDARNLNNNIRSAARLPVFSQEKARDVIKCCENLSPEEMKEMAPLSGKSRGSSGRTDTVSVSCIKEVKPEFAFDMDYTKERALDAARLSSQNTIFRLMGSTASLSDGAAAGLSREDFAEYMKTHELDREICWSGVETNLCGSTSYADLGRYSDYAAALYASLEIRINADFSGDERTAQLEKLNSVYESAVNRTVKGFSDSVGGAFAYLGTSLPEGKLEESVRRIMYDKRDAYRGYASKHSDYAGIEGSEDKWLRRDSGYMADALRKAYQPEKTGSGAFWGENELTALGMTGSLLANSVGVPIAPAADEESIGLSIAVTWLKTERILSDCGAGGEVRRLCTDLLGKYGESLIKAADRANAGSIKDPVQHYASASPYIDKSAVNDVLRVVQKSFRESGNAKKAIQDAAKFAYDTHTKKAKMPFIWGTYSLHGGESSDKYWENFYDNGKGQGSGIGKVLENWDSFDKLMRSGDLGKFHKSAGGDAFRTF